MKVPLRIALAVAVVAAGALAACAKVPFSPSLRPPSSNVISPAGTTFDIVPDGGGCKKDNGPYVFYGSSNQTITWRITNKCDRPVRVFVEKFKLKHKIFGGRNPFSRQPGPVDLKPAEEGTITAVVLDAAAVDDDEKGLNVYRYQVRIVWADGENKKDPEVIIEW